MSHGDVWRGCALASRVAQTAGPDGGPELGSAAGPKRRRAARLVCACDVLFSSPPQGSHSGRGVGACTVGATGELAQPQ